MLAALRTRVVYMLSSLSRRMAWLGAPLRMRLMSTLSSSEAAQSAVVVGPAVVAARKSLAGLVQMTAVNDREANFATCSALVADAAAKGCTIVFLPECFSFIGAKAGEAQAAAEPLNGPTMAKYCRLAKEHNLWLSLGGFQERSADETESRIYNTHVVVQNTGDIAASYRKIHLFDVPMTGLVESRQALPGDRLVACDSPCGRLGVTICYDLRFPELYQKLTFMHGAHVLLIPSAFAMKTGEAHWETLLRARAIETQTYVVAAAQAGLHNEDGNKRRSWGHAMAIDPWGKVVAQFGAEDTGLKTFEIDLDLVEATRANMPMHAHRRYDVRAHLPASASRPSPPLSRPQPNAHIASPSCARAALSQLYGAGPHQASDYVRAEKPPGDKGLFFG